MRPRRTPKEIAALVSMPRLLHALGFQDLNERTRRTRCILHSGSNPSAFSWTDDGLWYCFSEGHGGDRLALVQAVRKTGFRDGVSFLADLAGVPLDGSSFSRRETARARWERERLEALALDSLDAECVLRLGAANEVRSLERIRDRASQRLSILLAGERERWVGETEIAWGALKYVAERLPEALAEYYLLSFGSEKQRFEFVRCPTDRGFLVERTLLLGGLEDDVGRFVEVRYEV